MKINSTTDATLEAWMEQSNTPDNYLRCLAMARKVCREFVSQEVRKGVLAYRLSIGIVNPAIEPNFFYLADRWLARVAEEDESHA